MKKILIVLILFICNYVEAQIYIVESNAYTSVCPQSIGSNTEIKSYNNDISPISSNGNFMVFNKKPTYYSYHDSRPDSYGCSGPCRDECDSGITVYDFNSNCYKAYNGDAYFVILSNQVLINTSPNEFCKEIELKASGCSGPQKFYWEFSLDGINFNSLNVNTVFDETYKFIKTDHLPNNYAGNIYFRVLIDWDPTIVEENVYSNIILYSIIPCAPKVNDAIPVQNTTCSDSKDGYATFTFDRDLAIGEFFNFKLLKKENGFEIPAALDRDVYPSEFINKQFTWDNLGAGTYYLRYQTKLNGSTEIATAQNSLDFTITSPTAVAFTTNPQNVKCTNGNSGSISVTAQGGSGSYEYSKDGGATWQNSATFSGLVAGSYSVLVKDSKGCEAIQGAKEIDITEPYEALAIGIVEKNDPIEHDGNQGNIEVSASGGTGNLSFSWQNSFGSGIGSGAIISNLVGGSYTVTVTDANACSASRIISLTNPPVFSVSISSLKGVSCYGGSDAQLKAVVSGGAEPLFYEWEGAFSNEETLDDIPAGTYKVIVTDFNDVVRTASFTVSEPSALQANLNSVTAVSCQGGNNGGIDINVTGGTSPYSYQWKKNYQSFATTQDISNLSIGYYDVTITDTKGCTTELTNIEITEPEEGIAVALNPTSPLSFGATNGSINLDVSGGTAPYTYLWNTGSTAQNLQNIGAGYYSVTVTDSKSCTLIENWTLTQPEKLVVQLAPTASILCKGESTASLQSTVAGGVSPYSYQWKKDGQALSETAETLEEIPAGVYTIILTDANNIQAEASFTISEPTALEAVFLSKNNVSCKGGNNGSIDINVSGGTSPYSYDWINVDSGESAGTSQDLTGLIAGNYEVTISDKNGCTTELTNIEITEPEEGIAVELHPTSPLSFGATNGSINLDVSGGTSPYTYLWNTGSTAQNLQNIGAGNYSVTVTDSKLCTASENLSLTQPEKLVVQLAPTASILCKGESTASLQSTVAGGVSPYSYQWKKDGQALSETAETLEEIPAGVYTITVTDANNIQIEAGFTISEPTALAAQSTVTEVLCYGKNTGAIDFTISGGTPPYSYQWVKEGSTTVIATTQDLSNLVAGNYSVTATDTNGCTSQLENSTVLQPLAALTLASDIETPTSFGGSNGTIFLSVNGGTAPYTYNWNTGTTTQDLTNLKAGSYSVAVTDSHGCIKTLTAIMEEPGELTAHITQEEFVLCHGDASGVLQTSVSGGVKPYSYQWKKNGQWLSDATSSLANLTTGNYELKVTDKFNNTVNVSYTVSEPTTLSTSYQVTDVLCFGNATGAIDLTISGGTPPYTYLWNNGSTTQDVNNLKAGTYDVFCTDANGCTKEMTNIIISQPAAPLQLQTEEIPPSGFGLSNGSIDLSVEGGTAPYTYNWNTGTTTQDLTNLKAGDYTVTATDAHGCQATTNSSLSQPDLLETSPSITNPLLCFADANGSLTTVTKGGVAPYTYSWKKGTTPIASTAQIQNLTTATYSVTVTDKNNNQTTQTVVLGQPDLLTVGFESTPISCSGDLVGSLTALPQGGVLPYSYSWSNGASTAKISNMGTGNYLVNVIDANGCATLAKGTITSTSAIKVNSKVQDPSCYQACNGSITLEITGGSGDYSMEWDTAAKGNGLQATNLCAGNYSVTVKDNVNGCVLPMNFTLNQPQQLTVNAGDNQVLCAGQTAVIQSITNQNSLSYAWTSTNGFSASTAQVKLDKAGEYQLEVTNANGCKATDSVRITASDQLLDATFLVASQTYTNQDIVLINVSNPTGQTYEWLLPAEATGVSEISKSKIIKFSKIGVYTVALKAKNEAGCSTISSKQLVVEEDPKLPDPNPQVSSFIKEFLVYPNPTINNGLFTVKVSLSESAPISLTLYEQSNGSLLNQTDLPTSKEHLKEYRMSLSSGIYLIILRTSKGVQSKKIIVN